MRIDFDFNIFKPSYLVCRFSSSPSIWWMRCQIIEKTFIFFSYFFWLCCFCLSLLSLVNSGLKFEIKFDAIRGEKNVDEINIVWSITFRLIQISWYIYSSWNVLQSTKGKKYRYIFSVSNPMVLFVNWENSNKYLTFG